MPAHLDPKNRTIADETLDAEVLVIGSGASGCGAALQAIRDGARVTLIEKLDTTGGSAVYSAGGFWTFKNFETFRRLAADGDPSLQAKLVQDYPRMVEYLRSIVPVADEPNVTQQGNGISWKIQDIRSLLDGALEQVRSSGGVVLNGTAARELLWDGSRVTGVVARRSEGSLLRINADAVVLATGGFAGSRELLARYMGPNATSFLVRANEGSVGDGFRMAAAKGASAAGSLHAFYGHLIAHPPRDWQSDHFRSLTQYYSEHALLFNTNGSRFADETLGDPVLTEHLATQPDAKGVLIFDDEVRLESSSQEPAPGVGAIDRFAYASEQGAHTAQASTLESLVAAVAEWGFDTATLSESVQTYTRAVEAGALFADGVPVSPSARPPRKPPFHAVEVRPGITFTFGGIRVTTQGEVVDHDGNVIDGLFAGGADIGGISGFGYAGGLAPAFTTGTWAGEAAAALSARLRREGVQAN